MSSPRVGSGWAWVVGRLRLGAAPLAGDLLGSAPPAQRVRLSPICACCWQEDGWCRAQCVPAGRGRARSHRAGKRGGQDQSPQGAGQPLASRGTHLAGEQSPKPHQLYDLGSLHIPTWLMGDGCCCPQQRRGTHGAPRPRGQVRGAIRNGPPSTFWCFPPTPHKILSSQGHPGGTAALLAGGSAAPFTPRAPPCP